MNWQGALGRAREWWARASRKGAARPDPDDPRWPSPSVTPRRGTEALDLPAEPIASVPSTPMRPIITPPESPNAMPIVASSDPSLLPPQPIERVEWQPRARPSVPTRGGTDGWYIVLDDDRTCEIDRLVLMGRNPEPMPAEAGARLVVLGDESVSKTHLSVAVDDAGAFVIDRGSTNGTALVSSSGRLEPLMPGIRSRVLPGQRVSLGEHWFTVERRP